MTDTLGKYGLAISLFIALPALASSDTISLDIPNGYFAPLTIVEDHAQCSGPGQTAFKVEFTTGSLTYEIRHLPTKQTAEVSNDGDLTTSEPRCFVTTRRGTERIETEVSCDGGELTRSPFETIDLSDVTLSSSGSVAVCQSPFETHILESAWTVAADGPRIEVAVNGAIFQYPDAGCDGARPVEGPQMFLDYVQPTMAGIPTFGQRRSPLDDLDRVAPVLPTHFRLLLDGFPLSQSDGQTPRLLAKAQIFIFPTKNGESICPNGRCDLSRWHLRLPNVRSPRICP